MGLGASSGGNCLRAKQLGFTLSCINARQTGRNRRELPEASAFLKRFVATWPPNATISFKKAQNTKNSIISVTVEFLLSP